jgi:hypothetical protein
MGNFSVNLPDDVEDKFRREIAMRKGIKKGYITEALVEAINLWIASKPDGPKSRK